MFPKHWQVKRLNCPTCGKEIVTLPGDRAFSCGQCEQGFEIIGGQVRQLAVNQVYRGWWLRARPGGPPGEGAGGIVLLPFWRFELTAPESPSTLRNASHLPAEIRERMRGEERFNIGKRRVFAYYPAFRTARPGAAGNQQQSPSVRTGRFARRSAVRHVQGLGDR